MLGVVRVGALCCERASVDWGVVGVGAGPGAVVGRLGAAGAAAVGVACEDCGAEARLVLTSVAALSCGAACSFGLASVLGAAS